MASFQHETVKVDTSRKEVERVSSTANLEIPIPQEIESVDIVEIEAGGTEVTRTIVREKNILDQVLEVTSMPQPKRLHETPYGDTHGAG